MPGRDSSDCSTYPLVSRHATRAANPSTGSGDSRIAIPAQLHVHQLPAVGASFPNLGHSRSVQEARCYESLRSEVEQTADRRDPAGLVSPNVTDPVGVLAGAPAGHVGTVTFRRGRTTTPGALNAPRGCRSPRFTLALPLSTRATTSCRRSQSVQAGSRIGTIEVPGGEITMVIAMIAADAVIEMDTATVLRSTNR